MNYLSEAFDGTQALSIRRHVRSDLPFLRRFGRSLTGSSQLADLCVLQLMDDIAERPSIMVAAANPRRIAAPLPWFTDCLMSCTLGSAIDSTIAAVLSLEQSSIIKSSPV